MPADMVLTQLGGEPIQWHWWSRGFWYWNQGSGMLEGGVHRQVPAASSWLSIQDRCTGSLYWYLRRLHAPILDDILYQTLLCAGKLPTSRVT